VQASDARRELIHFVRSARNEMLGLALRRGLTAYRPVYRTTVEQWTDDYSGETLEFYANVRELGRYSMLTGYVRFMGGHPEILDVGCGVGLFRERLDTFDFARYVGVDPAPTAVERAKALSDERTSFVVGEGVPPELGTFDVVVANEVLYLAADPSRLIDEVVAAIKPGGSLLTSNWRHATEVGLYRLLDERLELVDAALLKNDTPRALWPQRPRRPRRGFRVCWYRKPAE
jgi:SAM-dependent methyltransferase